MTGEMNIITGTHENAVLVPTRALLVDQALIVKHGIVQRRTVKVGFRTLDFTEALSGLSRGRSRGSLRSRSVAPGRTVRQRRVDARSKTVTPPLLHRFAFCDHRKRALLLSLIGVVFGVAIFICTQAQTQGFAQYFIDSTIGSNGALIVCGRVSAALQDAGRASKIRKRQRG